MSKLQQEPEEQSCQTDADSTDEIEILEVVGLDEDAPPSGAGTPPDDDGEEIVFDLDRTPDERTATAVDPAPDSTRGVERAPPPPAASSISDQDRFLRLQADFENFKKRVEREQFEHRRLATATLVGRLLPVLDNFERAVSSVASGNGDMTFRDGVILIFRQLLDELRKEGLRPIDSVGEVFDPRVHDAVATEPCSGLPSHTVVEELQRGYLLHERLLRPSLVKVCIDSGDPDAPPRTDEES